MKKVDFIPREVVFLEQKIKKGNRENHCAIVFSKSQIVTLMAKYNDSKGQYRRPLYGFTLTRNPIRAADFVQQTSAIWAQRGHLTILYQDAPQEYLWISASSRDQQYQGRRKLGISGAIFEVASWKVYSQLRSGYGRKTGIETLDEDNQGMWALRAGLFYLRT